MQEKEIEIYHVCLYSPTVYSIRATALVSSYISNEIEDTVNYKLTDVTIEHKDGTEAYVEEEDLEYLLSTYDKDRVYMTVLDECRY